MMRCKAGSTVIALAAKVNQRTQNKTNVRSYSYSCSYSYSSFGRWQALAEGKEQRAGVRVRARVREKERTDDPTKLPPSPRRAGHAPPRPGTRPLASRSPRSRPRSPTAQLLSPGWQIHRRRPPRPGRSPFRPSYQGATGFPQPASIGRTVPHRDRLLPPARLPDARTAKFRRVVSFQPEPNCLPTMQRGDHPRLLAHRPPYHRRGGPRPRRPVPRRSSNVSHRQRPAYLPIHTLR